MNLTGKYLIVVEHTDADISMSDQALSTLDDAATEWYERAVPNYRASRETIEEVRAFFVMQDMQLVDVTQTVKMRNVEWWLARNETPPAWLYEPTILVVPMDDFAQFEQAKSESQIAARMFSVA